MYEAPINKVFPGDVLRLKISSLVMQCSFAPSTSG